jgi:capsular polysaccharide export protein
MRGNGSKSLLLDLAHRHLLCSKAIEGQWAIKRILGATLVRELPANGVLVWGRKPSAVRAERKARKLGLPLVRVEDGFLRSFGTGDEFPGLSLVLDTQGIYYDSTSPSDLENMLASEDDLMSQAEEVDKAMGLLLQHRLSKYNHAPDIDGSLLRFASNDRGGYSLAGGAADDRPRVLVIDQTFGDMSVLYGAAKEQTFSYMLQAAIEENPGALVCLKTHPEVSSGRKRGYLSDVQAMKLSQGGQLLPLREPANPIGLLQKMDKVYAATSGMGFEALLCGRPVRCFGLPWYAGWGATQDEQHSPRRTRRRAVRELFAAGYVCYSRYINPVTHQPGNIFDVIAWLVRQRQMAGLV